MSRVSNEWDLARPHTGLSPLGLLRWLQPILLEENGAEGRPPEPKSTPILRGLRIRSWSVSGRAATLPVQRRGTERESMWIE